MILSKTNIESINLDQVVEEYISYNKLSRLLIIVPTNRKIRYLKRELISQTPNKAVADFKLYTLGTFSTEIFLESTLSAKVLSEATAAVLLDKAFRDTKLKYFSYYKDGIPRGTLDRIKNVIGEYKRHGISPEKIFAESERLSGSEKLKAEDISNIYQNYLLNCKKLKAYEIGDIYESVLTLNRTDFDNTFKRLFGGIEQIIINGFDEFTKSEIEIINKAAEITGVKLFIIFDYYRYNPALFSHLDSCYENLYAKGFREIVDTSPTFFKAYHKKIRENLFIVKEKNEPIETDIGITKILANSPSEEVILIAKEIKRLIKNENIKPENISVVFNLISDHSGMIRTTFNEYGIPFNLTDRFTLSESHPVVALINFLEILENNFYYKNIFRALTGRWISIKDVELSNLLRVSSNLKILSGYNNWIETLDSIIAEIKFNHFDDDNNYLPLEYYIKARDNIETINQFLKPFNKKLTVDEFTKQLRRLIFELKLPEKIVNDHSEQIEKNVKAVTVFLETIDEIIELIKVEYDQNKKFSLAYYLSQIKTALQFARYNIKERHGSGVLITSVNEIRGLNFDYVFIGGMVDGEFPTRFHPEIFFSGSFKKDEYKYNLEERYHFYQALSSVSKRLYFSYCLLDDEKELTPSTFLRDFDKVFNSIEQSSKNFENLIYSKSELFRMTFNIQDDAFRTELFKLGLDPVLLEQNLYNDLSRQNEPFGNSPFTGFLSDAISGEANSKLTEHTEKQFSTSMLEDYAKCPFQYFLKRILLLETIDEPSEELESFELGSLVHSILFEFYKSIREENIILAKCDEEIFEFCEKLIFNIAESKIERLKLKSESIFFEKEKILGIAGNKRNSILYKFLEAERDNKDGFTPEYFELKFGKFSHSDEDDFDLDVNGVKVRGKIDRLDLNLSEQKYKVIDYKLSGKTPTRKELETGISLQLPLYIYASKIFIETQLKEKFDPANSIIYSLKLKEHEFGPKSVNILKSRPSEEDLIRSNNELIEICKKFIPEYVKNIQKGIFRLSLLEDRENKVCKFCDFKSICRIQEIN